MPNLIEFSDNVAELRESATIAVSQQARALRAAGRTVLDLGAGEPDFATPPWIVDAASKALREGATRYTAVAGIPALREAIARAATAESAAAGTDGVEADQVIVSTGAKQALFSACFVLFGAGDEVLVPSPSWPSYDQILRLARATPVPVPGDPERGLRMSADAARDAATPRTRGLILNSPCNPTGAVYSAEELGALLALAAERDWWVVSDEIYRGITFTADAPSALHVAANRDRLVVVDGVSKRYAMTGWRLGWAIAPREVITSMTALQSQMTSNATTVSQHAALAALSDIPRATVDVQRMCGGFRTRRDAARTIVIEAGIPHVPPDGAFYLLLDVGAAAAARSSTDGGDIGGTGFARRLLDRHGVATVPGEAFGAPGWLRVSYAAPTDDVVEGVRRVAALYRATD
ncbi:MAG TPA: pyridoxal phosphate-dependent aminotransferase [Gemmatimonadaceae bacterium]|nr:pyridoxal phosphate-dependent aminotransferase [Gemmatimonadaceae bacterium]